MVDIADTIADQVLAKGRMRRRVPTFRETGRTITLWGGPSKGQRFRPESDPWQNYVMTEMESGRWERIYDCGSSQYAGKTTIDVIIPCIREAIGRRVEFGYALPTLEDLDKAWQTKLRKALRLSGYGDHMPKQGPSARGGRGPTLQFVDPETGELEGQIVFMAGHAYGDTVPSVVIDEIDQFRLANGMPRWSDIEDIYARANSYGGRALRLGCGTIESDDNSIILVLVDEHGTGTRGWPQCPHCHRHQRIGWEDIRYDATDMRTAEDTVRLLCKHCATLWTEDDRQRALRGMRFAHRGQEVDEHGEVTGDAPRTRYLGCLRPALECTMASMPILAQRHFLATQAIVRSDHELMRKFYRYQLCQVYTADRDELERGVELTWQSLHRRSVACSWGPVRYVTDKAERDMGFTYSRHIADIPADCAFTVAGIDVQGNRVYTVLVGATLEGTTYDVAWSYEMARSDHAPWNRQELHALLDRVDVLLHRWSAGTTLAMVGLDIGDFVDDLMPWLRGRQGGASGQIWRATRGKTTPMIDQAGDIEGLVRPREGVFNLEVNHLRELIHAAYRRPNGTAGAAHIPNGLTSSASDTAYLRHLVAEKMIIDPRSGRPKLQQGPGRWDWQDARRIAEALVRWNLRARPKPVQVRVGGGSTQRPQYQRRTSIQDRRNQR